MKSINAFNNVWILELVLVKVLFLFLSPLFAVMLLKVFCIRVISSLLAENA